MNKNSTAAHSACVLVEANSGHGIVNITNANRVEMIVSCGNCPFIDSLSPPAVASSIDKFTFGIKGASGRVTIQIPTICSSAASRGSSVYSVNSCLLYTSDAADE